MVQLSEVGHRLMQTVTQAGTSTLGYMFIQLRVIFNFWLSLKLISFL